MLFFAKEGSVWWNTPNFLDLGGWPGVPPGALCLTLENFYMKKTLVAAAILAASGASFAQATITGSYVFGWTNTTVGSAVSSGLSTDTAAVQFAASEDLGGGMKADAKVSFGGAMRGSKVGGEDAFVQLSGGFGRIKAGSMEAGTAYDVNSGVGAPIYGFDGNVFANNVTNDSVTYYMPAFGPATVSVGYADYSDKANNTVNGPTGTAIIGQAGANGNDAGTSGSARSVNVTAAVAAGPLSGRARYQMYQNQDASATSSASRYYIDAAYDMGAVKVGFGYAVSQYNGDKESANQAEVDVSAPIGALTVGAGWAQAKGGAAATRTGLSVGVSYALSKRTSIGAAYRTLTINDVADKTNDYRVLLGHSF